jgi:hypothetical protein
MYEVLCETLSGPVVVDRTENPEEGYLVACNLQAEGKYAWMQEEDYE